MVRILSPQNIIEVFKGIAIGDAFGVGLEFQSRLWITKNIDFTRFVNVWKGGQNNISPGTYSDDTEHTFGVIEALLSNSSFTEDLLLQLWKREYDRDKETKGFPRDGHGSIEAWYKGIKTIEQVREEQMSREDPGNAPVMRAVPLVFVPKELMYEYAMINANATHPHPMGRAASFLTALLGWHYIFNKDIENNLLEVVKRDISYYPLEVDVVKMIAEVDALPRPGSLSTADYTVLHGVQPLPYIKWDTNIYGLPCAAMKTALNVAYVLKHSTNTFDALQKAILMGGDIDSLSAVATGIAAAKHGLGSLPAFLLEQTEGLARMEELGKKFYEKFYGTLE